MPATTRRRTPSAKAVAAKETAVATAKRIAKPRSRAKATPKPDSAYVTIARVVHFALRTLRFAQFWYS